MVSSRGIEVKPGQIWTIGKTTISRINRCGEKLHKNTWNPITNQVTVLKTNKIMINVRDSNGTKIDIKSQNLGKLIKDVE